MAGNRRQTSRYVLAAGQIALALVLLISAGLLTRSFLRLRAVDPGFDPRGILTAGITLPSVRYASDTSRIQFFHRLMTKLHTIPGIAQASLVTPLPMSGDFDTTGIQILGRSMIPAGDQEGPDRYVVTPDYFSAIRIPLLQGRLFDGRDDAVHKNVAIVSRTAARILWSGESPIGKKFRAGSASGDFDHSPFREIVGVVGDVAQYGLASAPRPQIYMPYDQYADGSITLLVRATREPLTLAEPVRRAVLAADREQPIYDVIPFQSLVEDSIAGRRFAIGILAGFALGALALASIGIYGVISYSVAQRRQEFGIRMALGARPRDVLHEAAATGLPMIAAGTTIGVAGAFVANKFLALFLFGINSADLVSFVGVPLAMIVVALAACYIPAMRAAKVDLLEALKYE